MKEDSGMKEFLSYLKPYKRDAVMAVFCIEAETVFELIIPLVMASIVDVGVVNGDRRYILMKGLQMVLFALISLVLGQGSAMFSARCGQGLGAEIRKAEFAKLQQFSFANTDHFSSSSLVTRLTSDVTTIQNSVAAGMRPAFRSPVMMLTAMAASFYINPQLAMVFLVAAPVLGALLFFIISRVRPLYSVMQGAIDMVNRIIQENLTAIRVVKSYVRGDHEIRKFEEVNYNLRFTAEKAFRLAVLNMPAMQLVMYSTILCILWFGGRLVTVGGVKVGQTVGIIGQTGAAKSTLVQLIPRLYDVTNGTVYIDGRPVREYPLKRLRDSIAMVLQKNTLFSGTVKDNLRWGRETATDQEIEEACRIACVDEFIDRLERGYETELGQGGINVSGGQKQRLCIARAILKSPKVLILDDSTSAVDTATEAKIRDGLAKSMPDTTKIIIAQRISSVAHADQIIILEDGRVNAVGSHETLLASNQIYQDIYHSQQEGANL